MRDPRYGFETRRIALRELLFTPVDGRYQLIEALSYDPDPRMRVTAVLHLAGDDWKGHRERLRALSANPVAGARWMALRALAHNGSFEPLLAMTIEPEQDNSVCPSPVSTLGWLLPGAQESAPEWYSASDAERREFVREHIRVNQARLCYDMAEGVWRTRQVASLLGLCADRFGGRLLDLTGRTVTDPDVDALAAAAGIDAQALARAREADAWVEEQQR